jgi:hypothetical protein
MPKRNALPVALVLLMAATGVTADFEEGSKVLEFSDMPHSLTVG